MGRAEEEATVAQEEAATEAEETEAEKSEEAGAAEVPVDPGSENKAAAAALHANIRQKPKEVKFHQNSASKTLNPSAPNAVSNKPQTLTPGSVGARNTRKQPLFQSLFALQAKRQPFQRPQPDFSTPAKRNIQPRQPPGRPHQPPMLNLATSEEANPNQSQPGQQADFEYDTGYRPGRNNNFTGNFSHPQGGFGHDNMPSQDADYSEFDPPGFHDESLSSQYNDLSGTVPNYSCGVPLPVMGNAATASYGADPEAVVGQKRKFSGPPHAAPRPTQRPFIRGTDPLVGPAQAPAYPINGHTGKLGVQGDYDAHNPQGETYMERRMQWAMHRLHTLEERMLRIETAGGAYNGRESNG
ncbi:MAG: hypothetical protein FRX49_13174 [Trebouxia sp. A1-2]|nr:MAG: hypothetical protein FRX49_13174 [Trebouxia sp. A1-2]